MRSQWAMCVLATGMLLSGCSQGTARFVPTVDSAREAVEMTLEAWKKGEPLKLIDEFEPGIQPVDSRWQQGRKLLDYEILDEHEVEGAKQIKVRLTLDKGLAPEETSYVVIGQNPLYVYWLTDYEQSSKTM